MLTLNGSHMALNHLAKIQLFPSSMFSVICIYWLDTCGTPCHSECLRDASFRSYQQAAKTKDTDPSER